MSDVRVQLRAQRDFIVLEIGQEELDRARQLLEFALAHPCNKEASPRPGDDPRYCASFPHGFRIIFSITAAESSGELYRHLTVSHESGVFPHPMHVHAIGSLLGFQGDIKSWLVALESSPGCTRRACPCHRVVALQPVSAPSMTPSAPSIVNAPGGRA